MNWHLVRMILGLLLGLSGAVAAESGGEGHPLSRLLAAGEYARVVAEGLPLLSTTLATRNPTERIDLLVALGVAYQALGHFSQAGTHLEEARSLAEETPSRRDEVQLLSAWGDFLLATGRGTEALAWLTPKVSTLREGGVGGSELASLLNTLGNARAAGRHYAAAAEAFQEAATLAGESGDAPLQGVCLANLVHLALRGHATEAGERHLAAALPVVRGLPDGHRKGFALVSLGHMALEMARKDSSRGRSWSRTALAVLQEGATIARGRSEWTLLSHALGDQGGLYELAARYSEAERLTREALFHAQNAGAPESQYLWEWQLGRLAKAQGQTETALTWYRQAIKTLVPVRPDLHLGLRDAPDSFRELIGPVYYQLADLLLRGSAREPDRHRREQALREARDTVEMLKTAEMQSLFRDECLAVMADRTSDLDQMPGKTVVYYPIMLSDRLELLLTLPTGLSHVTVPVTAAELRKEVQHFRQALEDGEGRGFLPHAERLYRWLIAPVQAELQRAGAATLVVVPDDVLRTIPFGALHDGQGFLVERLAVATTPSLRLTNPLPLDRSSLSVLVNGLSAGVQNFPPLPNVLREVARVHELFPGRVLLDEDFTVRGSWRAMEQTPYTIVHIASHGQFDRDPSRTFLLAYDGKISLDALAAMVGRGRVHKQPVELLTLSACQTAVGDDRAALGLAGVAIKAGARSALASLWFIDDEATAGLVSEFYRQLKEGGHSKAQALQKAQIKLIHDRKTAHPGLWASMILIGNWL